MENTSIDCTKIRNNSKRTKTSRNEVMQPTASNNHLQPNFSKLCQQPERFDQPFINGIGFIYFGILKMILTLGKIERLIFDYMCIILGSWKSDD